MALPHHGPLTQMAPSAGEAFGARPSLQFSVPCLEVTDEEGKPPSFKWLFYELPLPEFPFKVSFFVANGWCNGSGDYVQSMIILRPDKQTMLVETGRQPFKLSDRSVPFMAVNFFQEIVFDQPGVYWMQVFLDGRMSLEYPLTVRKADDRISQKPREPGGAQSHGGGLGGPGHGGGFSGPAHGGRGHL